jgi:serine protease Do
MLASTPVPGFGEIAEQLRRSTVLITAGANGRGNGSGVIWSSSHDGGGNGNAAIITNAHVARGPRLRVQLWDGREFDATVAARDFARDLAHLQLDTARSRLGAADLTAAIPGDSSHVRPGELAIAIGNPLGFVGALTTGVIHAVGPLRGLGPQTWVQANVRLAPGNSGGPLADAAGRVIGINTMAAGRLALAIPSNVVVDFLASQPSDASDGWLGVTLYPVQVPRPGQNRKAFGLVILEMETDSPAAQASLLPGDILLGTEDNPFAFIEDLSRALRGAGPRTLRLEFLRGDYTRVRRVTLQLGEQRRHNSSTRSSVAA